MALSVLAPRLLEQYPGFEFNWDAMVLRREGGGLFEDLASLDQMKNVFYDEYTVANAKSPTGSSYRKPSRAAKLLLIIGTQQWEAMLDHMEHVDAAVEASESPLMESPDLLPLSPRASGSGLARTLQYRRIPSPASSVSPEPDDTLTPEWARITPPPERTKRTLEVCAAHLISIATVPQQLTISTFSVTPM